MRVKKLGPNRRATEKRFQLKSPSEEAFIRDTELILSALAHNRAETVATSTGASAGPTKCASAPASRADTHDYDVGPPALALSTMSGSIVSRMTRSVGREATKASISSPPLVSLSDPPPFAAPAPWRSALRRYRRRPADGRYRPSWLKSPASASATTTDGPRTRPARRPFPGTSQGEQRFLHVRFGA